MEERTEYAPVIVSKGLYDEIMMLSKRGIDKAMAESKELNLRLAHTWISRYPDKYNYGMAYGFFAHIGADESVSCFKDGVLQEFDDTPYGFVLSRLCDGYLKKSETVNLLTAKYKKSKNRARAIFNGVIRDLRNNGCIIGILKGDKFALKFVPSDITKDQEGERIMSKSKKNSKSKTSKKVAPKKDAPKKPKAEKESKPKVETIRSVIEGKLRSGKFTKQELVEVITTSGLSKKATPESAVKYLNLMFYKMRKSGIDLQCKHEEKEGGGIRGRFFIK